MSPSRRAGGLQAWWKSRPPQAIPITFAIFGLLVYLISFIPVIVKLRASPIPISSRMPEGTCRSAASARAHVTERRFASALIVALVIINQLQVAINVRLSFFNRDWFNAIQSKDSAAFWSLLFGVFCFWAAIFVVST